MDYKEDIAWLYREYATGILRMCYLYLGDFQLAEDATQETFVKVFRNYKKFRGASKVKSWITRIAINVCKDMLADNGKRKTVAMSVEEFASLLDRDAVEPKKSDFHVVEERMVLSRAIGRLDRKLREVVVLFYYQELSTKEIADITGIARTTVEFWLKRARKYLKRELKGEDFIEILGEPAGD